MKNESDLPLIEAARWRMRLTQAPQDRGDEFRAWLMADARNGEAWSQVQTAWDALDGRATSPKLVQWRQDALAYARRAAVSPGTSKGLRRPWAIVLGVAATLALAVAAPLWSTYRFDDYRTTAGERRVVTLADGSEIALDSDSEVEVRFGRHARELILVSGQARFNVAHDMLRPFLVQAQHHQVVATGTSFNVDLTGADLVVTLIEGRVVVLPPPASRESESTLDAGEQLVLSPVAPPRIVRVNVDHAIAWESGALVFDNEPLSKVIRRISRYGGPPISVADASTANLRISGVFREGDTKGFIDTVVSYLALSAEQQPDGSIRLRAGAGSDAPDPQP